MGRPVTRAERQRVLAIAVPFDLLAFITPWIDVPAAAFLALVVAFPAILITGMAIAYPTTEEPTND